MSHVILVGSQPRAMLNFRGELIRSIVSAGHTVTAMTTGATTEDIEALRRLGANHRAYCVKRNGLNPLEDVATLMSLRTAFREINPDVVLSYTIKPIIWSGLATRWRDATRFYALVTGLGFSFHGHGVMRRLLTLLVSFLYRIGLGKAAGVVFQNRDNAALFIHRGIVPAHKCSVTAGSGVDLTKFSRMPLPASGTVFLTVSRLLGEKGLREYAEAARMVKESHPEATFWLVGPEDPSPDGISLREVIDWQQRGWITYHGASRDIRPFLASCSVFVLPSYHEGMPRAVLEALAVGRPIITTDVPGCRDTVLSNDNGFLVPSRDAGALAERMCWFIENRLEWDRMARRSRALAEERFDVRRVNEELLRIMKLLPDRRTVPVDFRATTQQEA